MDANAAKLIGAGLATISLAGVGVGIGQIFGSYISGSLRNPAAAPKVFGNVLLGFALTEAVALYALVIAMLLLFVSNPPIAAARLHRLRAAGGVARHHLRGALRASVEAGPAEHRPHLGEARPTPAGRSSSAPRS